MVSSELIEGDRDRIDVGVLGMLEAEPKEYVGYGSLVYLLGANEGDELRELLGLPARACRDGALALVCSGLAGRLLDRGNVLE